MRVIQLKGLEDYRNGWVNMATRLPPEDGREVLIRRTDASPWVKINTYPLRVGTYPKEWYPREWHSIPSDELRMEVDMDKKSEWEWIEWNQESYDELHNRNDITI